MNINDFNKLSNMANIERASSHIKETNERYHGNKTMNQEASKAIKVTLSWFILSLVFGIILGFIFIYFEIEFIFGIFIALLVGSIFLIAYVIIDMKVIKAGLSNEDRIRFDEGYGQLIAYNGDVYYTDYAFPHTKEEAIEFVSLYLDKKILIPDLNIYKLLDIKYTKRKKYRGRPIEIVAFTYDLMNNPVKTEIDRLYSVKIPIDLDDPYYNQMKNLPQFEETEEDRINDKKALRNSFITTTIVLGYALWMPITNLFFISLVVGLAVYYAWECTTSEIESFKITRYLLRLYLIVVVIIGFIHLFIHMGLL